MTEKERIDRLFQAISGLESKEECLDFFADLCTEKEVSEFAKRFEAAIMLSRGENYNTVTAELGLSTATISRVSKCLSKGPGGYKKALEKLQNAENNAENK